MGLKKAIAATYMRLSRWTFVHEPLPKKVVLIGAPHTSNWDGFLMVMCFWRIGRPYKFLVKESAAKNPVVGPIVRWVGGVPVNRPQGHTIPPRLLEIRLLPNLPGNGAAPATRLHRFAHPHVRLEREHHADGRRQSRHGPDPRVLRGQARQTTGQLERPPAPGGRGVIPAARLRPNPADLTK